MYKNPLMEALPEPKRDNESYEDFVMRVNRGAYLGKISTAATLLGEFEAKNNVNDEDAKKTIETAIYEIKSGYEHGRKRYLG